MVGAASSPESAWIRWLPTNPAAPVTSTTPDSLGLLTVLFLVIVAERRASVLDWSPPPLVGPVPLDHSLQAVAECHLWRPTQGTQLGGVQAVPAVVAGPVGHRLDQVVGRSRISKILCVRSTSSISWPATDVVHIARLTSVKQ